ncbi:hypothetical protein MOMUL_20450 [Moorella mulderi DSM 14980]|uniref:Uncharacterized protein n=1 Tax=Moorella mulderi DSM 14980 TaxID=1122241 RepID=A0A151AVU7_9FIRM|nr:hypothetical protein MOMUL_20450 [Moorella mulderi DSM 14980]
MANPLGKTWTSEGLSRGSPRLFPPAYSYPGGLPGGQGPFQLPGQRDQDEERSTPGRGRPGGARRFGVPGAKSVNPDARPDCFSGHLRPGEPPEAFPGQPAGEANQSNGGGRGRHRVDGRVWDGGSAEGPPGPPGGRGLCPGCHSGHSQALRPVPPDPPGHSRHPSILLATRSPAAGGRDEEREPPANAEPPGGAGY